MSPAFLSLRVKPGAATSQIVGWQEDVLEVRIAAPPREGRANAALIQYLAEVLGVSPSRLSIVGGHRARHKRVAVEGLEQDEVWRRLEARMPRSPERRFPEEAGWR